MNIRLVASDICTCSFGKWLILRATDGGSFGRSGSGGGGFTPTRANQRFSHLAAYCKFHKKK